MNWLERQIERLRSFNPLAVDGFLAVIFTVISVVTVFGEAGDEERMARGFTEPSTLVLITLLVTCAPIAFRRRWPLAALLISAIGIFVHFLVGWPEGSLPLAVLFLTYTVAVWSPLRKAIVGLSAVIATARSPRASCAAVAPTVLP